MVENEVTINKNLEILDVAKTIAKEKGINSDEVLEAMEVAIAKAGRTKYGYELDIRASIDKESGYIGLFRYREVVKDIEELDPEERLNKINLDDLPKENSNLEIGQFLVDELPPLDFGRIAVQTAKHVIFQKVKEAERIVQFNEFKDRVGEIVNGVVKRVEFGNLIVDLGKGEAILKKDELLNREIFRRSDRIRAFITEVKHDLKGPQIFLSRAHNNFLVKLFEQEVPEIYDGVIEVKSVARDPGSRAKIAVYTIEKSIDPVGACVGMRGSRVQAVVNELQGEKIDILSWTDDIASFVVKALQPAEVQKVVLYEGEQRLEVVVPEEQLSLAIGRRGQNVRLASSLCGWDIDILTEDQESERRQKEFQERTNLFMEALDVDELLSQLLVTEGFTDINELAFVDLKEISNIAGFDEDTAEEIQARATDFLNKENKELEEKCNELGIADDLLEIEDLSLKMIVTLGENDVKTLEDFAYCSSDDLLGWDEIVEGEKKREEGILEGFDISISQANDLIMSARVKLGIIPEEDEIIGENEEGDIQNNETDNIVNVID